MELFLVIVRCLHVLLALVWVGLAVTVVLAVGPSLMGLGLPERKAYQLQFLPRQTALATLGGLGTIITGLLLLWMVYGAGTGLGFGNARGYWIILGSLLGIGAFSIALAVIVPTAKKVLGILQGQGNPTQMGPLVAKLARTGPIVLMHMFAATVCMLAAGHGMPFSVLTVSTTLGTGVGFGLAMLAFSRKIKA